MLKKVTLQNFRSYPKKEFVLNEKPLLVVGPNTAGKTNFIESIYLLSTGKSFKTDKDNQMVTIDKEVGRVKGEVDELNLEVVLTNGYVSGRKTAYKKFTINGVSKRRVDFEGNLPSVLFSPQDLEIVIGSPSLRRNFLDEVLEQTDRDYRIAGIEYTKALRQRNALLGLAKDTGRRNKEQFDYWDELLILNGQHLSQKREELIEKVNNSKKKIFDLKLLYDKSEISKERLTEYENAEVAVGVTLVGPHRDDLKIMFEKDLELKSFGSRGQQRLGVLQLKFIQLALIEEKMNKRPLLLLDDVFSELDEGHIDLILEIINTQQTIITTTHEEFVKRKTLKDMEVIELIK